ncbi:hypothetical protein [Cupriavidus sp. WS]|uniref:hypothetical protein n=1 Tax=Cupriavidus sp. WS TaxID=1312922 RepID=UPI0009DBFAA3|nr:hypothetical protein [Cupriavidus sp. WS]
MTDRLVSPSTGKTLIPLAKRTTTPTPADAPKPVHVAREFIEVVVFDGRLASRGSQFGHAAVEIDGTVYSRAPSTYFKGSYTKYLRSNTALVVEGAEGSRPGMFRDAVGLKMWVSPREKKLIRDELERRVAADSKYSLFGNSCSSNVADVLELAGIMAHDPRGFQAPVTPAELLAVLEKSNRLVQRRFYGKGYEGGASGNW